MRPDQQPHSHYGTRKGTTGAARLSHTAAETRSELFGLFIGKSAAESVVKDKKN
jgi:hypothetical protein